MMIQGINENVLYRNVEFHIQTEDKGASRGVIVSTLFHGGMIIFEKRVSYGDLPESDKNLERLGALLKTTHDELKKGLLKGELDERISLFIPIGKDQEGKGKSSSQEEEMVSKVREDVLPSLVRDLGVELSRDDLAGIRNAIRTASSLPPKERYLTLYAEIFNIVKDRCDREAYKRQVRIWTGLSKPERPSVREKASMPSGRPAPASPDHAVSISVPEMKELVRRVTVPELTRVIGESLSEALYHKVFSEIHDSFYQRENAFELLADRLLNAGIVRKRVTDEWRDDVKATWIRRYRKIRDLEPSDA
jgi:hypothetical protein